jgi:hypothetical protein
MTTMHEQHFERMSLPEGLCGGVQTQPHTSAQPCGQTCRVFEGTVMEKSGRAGAIVRSEYLIDRFRVVFETGGGWHCGCAEFASTNACAHTREAAGMRAAQAQIVEHVATSRSQFAQNAWSSRASPSPVASAVTRPH